MNPPTSPAMTAIEDRLFAALAVLRCVLLVNTLGLSFVRRGNFHEPEAAILCLGVMVLWTGLIAFVYSDQRRRTTAWLLADLTLAVALMLVTPLIKGDDFRATMPGFWVSSALLAWAIRFGWRGGLAAGLILAIVDIGQRNEVRQSDFGNAFLLVVVGTVVGYLCSALQTMAVERAAAERAAAAAQERTRLALSVHDGVLQVLALVQRRGRELGGEFAELSQLAADQEQELRRLIRTDSSTTPATGVVDLTTALVQCEQRPGVTVATPDHPVELPTAAAAELLAAVNACLDNVRLHAGDSASAWVLLHADGDRVTVVVRDDGPGIPAGRLESAAAQGRMGVAKSIRGRLDDIGGTAHLATGSFGTEWELVVPREGRAAQ